MVVVLTSRLTTVIRLRKTVVLIFTNSITHFIYSISIKHTLLKHHVIVFLFSLYITFNTVIEYTEYRYIIFSLIQDVSCLKFKIILFKDVYII